MKTELYSLLYKFCLLLAVSSFMSGCATYGQHANSVRTSLLNGQVGVALAAIEAEDKDQNDVLSSLNKAILRRMAHDYSSSNEVFAVAKQQIEDLYGVSVTDQLGAVTVNDTLRDYSGDRYEQVLLHAFMAMNYIQLGDLDAARVEILQADVKMQEWGEAPDEDPFMRYFAGMIYEALGETDQAVVSYRQAKEIYTATVDKQGIAVPQILKEDLLRGLAGEGLWDEYKNLKNTFGMTSFKPTKLGKGFGEVIVVLNNGLAPVRTSSTIVTASTGEVVDTVKIAIPIYAEGPSALYRARLSAGGKKVELQTVENIDALARKALEDDMPVITARAIARAVIKHATQKEAEDQGGALAGFLMTVTNMVTEQGDTRSWSTLPQEIQLARMVLPKGPQKVQIEMLNSTGVVVDTISKTVNVKSGESSFLAEHWTAPNMTLTAIVAK